MRSITDLDCIHLACNIAKQLIDHLWSLYYVYHWETYVPKIIRWWKLGPHWRRSLLGKPGTTTTIIVVWLSDGLNWLAKRRGQNWIRGGDGSYLVINSSNGIKLILHMQRVVLRTQQLNRDPSQLLSRMLWLFVMYLDFLISDYKVIAHTCYVFTLVCGNLIKWLLCS